MKKNSNKPIEANKATLKPQEVAKLLGIGKNRIYAALADGDLPSIMIGGRRLVPRVALERLLGGER